MQMIEQKKICMKKKIEILVSTACPLMTQSADKQNE